MRDRHESEERGSRSSLSSQTNPTQALPPQAYESEEILIKADRLRDTKGSEESN